MSNIMDKVLELLDKMTDKEVGKMVVEVMKDNPPTPYDISVEEAVGIRILGNTLNLEPIKIKIEEITKEITEIKNISINSINNLNYNHTGDNFAKAA